MGSCMVSQGVRPDGESPASSLRCPSLTYSTVSEGNLDETPAGFTGPVAGGMNEILEHLWPRISAYASDAIINEVQPQLLAALPSALQGLRFEKERCHLGTNPVEFRSIHIDKETQITANGVTENLVFQARVEWFADLSVYLTLAGAGLGIRGLSFKGVLLLKLVGLMDRPPFFEGVRVYFNNSPDIDLQFQGTGNHLLNMGSIRSKILEMITSQINATVVVPNRLGYSIVPDADIFTLKSPPAQGVLTLTVWSADKLLPMDTNWFGRGTSDPYVSVACGAYKFRSPTKYKTLSPTFAYTVSVPIADAVHQRVQLELFDEDLLTSDDFLGKLSLPVSKLVDWGKRRRVTCQLVDEQGEKGKNGTVRVSSEWRPLLLDGKGTHFAGPGVVYTGIYSATKLPILGNGATYWVAVHCGNLLKGFEPLTSETEHLERLEEEATTDSPRRVEMMKEKLALLRSYGMSEADMAKLLDVEEDMLAGSLERSSTSLALGLAQPRTCTVQWDRSFEFLVGCAQEADVSFQVWCQAAGASKLLGTYKCQVSELAACHNGTSWRTVAVPNTQVSLKLKLQMRYMAESRISTPPGQPALGGA
eukprot:TRINITY_DN47211_c0_g1_i1.p1 TRINITY_DN47211_c0_g1~~TRINITY_DN47211_c0_g1_i1.p1  ORF type:complete len:590 (+),score=104.81 TRINITY_DN47211_c0_g1_i1:49-1818(+)